MQPSQPERKYADLAAAQREHWEQTYSAHPRMYGEHPSDSARYAAELFQADGARTVLELGAGHGRDALHFARSGLTVYATDVSTQALAQLRRDADKERLTQRVETYVHDVRRPLPLLDAAVDAVYAHMLLCMALSTAQIRALVSEVRRVLRPGGAFVYTVRHTGDAHYGAGIAHGEDIHENDGFAVHFFDRALVDALAQAWTDLQVHDFEEGELPRRLWRVTQRRPV